MSVLQSVAPDQTPSEAVSALTSAAAAESIELHSILVAQNGDRVAESYRAPFDAQTPHRMYSVTKSFTSSAIGFAVSEGLFAVDDHVAAFFPEHLPFPTDANLSALTVKHLLTMAAGQAPVALAGPARPVPAIAEILAPPLAATPGTRFEYSNDCSYLLAAIVERATGMSLDDYLGPRLFEPLGIQRRAWLKSEEGVTNGGWGLHLTTRELWRFGQLYLQKGQWEGQQILPHSWIAEATARQSQSWGPVSMPDWNVGYGYQFWRCRNNAYRADGLLGQFCIILDDLDAVVVTTAGTASTQRLLDLVWTILLPALGGDAGPAPLPADEAIADRRRAEGPPPKAGALAGITFALTEAFSLPSRHFGTGAKLNAAMIEEADGRLALSVQTTSGSYRLGVGTGEWTGGTSPVSTGYPEPYKARAVSKPPDKLELELVFTEAGFSLVFVFGADPPNVSVKLPENPGLNGQIVVGRPFP